ncbi:DUF3306 domain-containing protein [Photobacterium sagamiensis]|uniref:DUF3306 domain-containing protein n=1 Tax=Photobacterium sagamiensis TaxID=2910241 RepID=UPI003D096A2D
MNSNASDARTKKDIQVATDFIQRWSSRKLDAKEGKTVEPEVLTQQDTLSDAEAVITQKSDLEQNGSIENDLTPDGNPMTLADVANVSFASGAASFLKTGVEKSVKKAALRKLFHSDEFNYISDMDDHTEDFSNIPPLDPSVVKQLRGWVNEAVEKVGNLAEKLSDESVPASTVDSEMGIDDLSSGTSIETATTDDVVSDVTEESLNDEVLNDDTLRDGMACNEMISNEMACDETALDSAAHSSEKTIQNS